MTSKYLTAADLIEALQDFPGTTLVKVPVLDYHNVPIYYPIKKVEWVKVTPALGQKKAGICVVCDPCQFISPTMPDCENNHYDVIALEAE
jgi:hypothetical protein